MLDTLLATKYYIPPPRSNLVPRLRLLRKLDESMVQGQRLLLISAPAGYGKTTLLTTWLHERLPPTAVAWISLDDGDNDRTRFLTYLITALQLIRPGVGETALAVLQSSQRSSLEIVLISLINDIAASSDPCWLVLDDYHTLESQEIHDAVSFLLEHLPLHTHIAIATRADPPLLLARLRARGQLVEIRQDDLRFNLEEIGELVHQGMGLNLSPDDIIALLERTEGWIAGLHMAMISMQKRTDNSSFIRCFTGSSHYIMDYLVEEVLQHQPVFIQEFLLQTSILNSLCASLCDAVSDIQYPSIDLNAPTLEVKNSQALLQYLEHANLFVVPLDDKQHWYRYHQLFSDLLRQRFELLHPERVPILHQRAIQWYEQNGLIPEAIEHALDAKDFSRAAGLIEDIAEATLMRSEIATLHGWVEALPGEVLDTRPVLCAYHAWELLLSGHAYSEAEACLQKAAHLDTTGLVQGAIAALRAIIATYQGDAHTSIQMGLQALEKLPENNLFLRSAVTGSLSLNYFWRGDIDPARRTLEEAASLSHRAGNLMNEVLAVTHLGDICGIQGRMQEAKTFYEQAMLLATDTHGQLLPIAGIALCGLGNLFREWHQLDQALQCLNRGIELTRKWSELGIINGCVALARTRLALGDQQGTREAIRAAQQTVDKFDAVRMNNNIVPVHQARISVWQGDIHSAESWIENKGFQQVSTAPGALRKQIVESPLPLFSAFEWVALAQILLGQRKYDRALAVLEPLIQVYEDAGWTGTQIYLLALQALAVSKTGDHSRAMQLLASALILAEPEGLIQSFVDEGEPMRSLMADYYSLVKRQPMIEGEPGKKRLLAYIEHLLAAFQSQSISDHSDLSSSDLRSSYAESYLIEPLTGRECEVLSLLSRGLTSTEIAEKLIISANTARSHIKTIYGKLDVHNRFEALERAKKLKLI